MALLRVNVVVLGFVAGAAAVGVYAAAYRLLETVLFIPWILSRAVYPIMTADPRPGPIHHVLDRTTGVLAALFLPYAAVLPLRGDEILGLLYGSAFLHGPGGAILAWLGGAPLLFGLSYFAADALLGPGPNGRVLVGSALALVTDLALLGVLLPVLHTVAAAIATTAACSRHTSSSDRQG